MRWWSCCGIHQSSKGVLKSLSNVVDVNGVNGGGHCTLLTHVEGDIYHET